MVGAQAAQRLRDQGRFHEGARSDHDDGVVGEHFAGRLAAARAADLLPLCEELRPDVIVRDEMEFGFGRDSRAAGDPPTRLVLVVQVDRLQGTPLGPDILSA